MRRLSIEAIQAGSRSALSKAITLVESTQPAHRHQVNELLTLALQHPRVCHSTSLRLGIAGLVAFVKTVIASGPPGAGKSSLIESLGSRILQFDNKVAVLAVDPSSSRTGGSILGDKTRMTQLSRNHNAYVRASPSKGTLGGAAQHTNEAIVMCELAGYDVIFVETVGIGQSEIAIKELVDMVILVVPPAAGDEIQALKKGIVEIADLVVVNKADGDLLKQANHAKTDYMHALQLLRPLNLNWHPEVLACSSHKKQGIDEIWENIQKYYRIKKESGELSSKRKEQRAYWLWNEVHEQLMDHLRRDKRLKSYVDEMQIQLDGGHIMPRTAASNIIQAMNLTMTEPSNKGN